MWNVVTTPRLRLLSVQREAACQKHVFVMTRGPLAVVGQSVPAIVRATPFNLQTSGCYRSVRTGCEHKGWRCYRFLREDLSEINLQLRDTVLWVVKDPECWRIEIADSRPRSGSRGELSDLAP